MDIEVSETRIYNGEMVRVSLTDGRHARILVIKAMGFNRQTLGELIKELTRVYDDMEDANDGIDRQ